VGRRAELRELSDQEVRDWVAPRRAGWRVALENNGIDGSVGAIVRAHNAFAGGGVQLIGRAAYNKRAAVGTHQHEPVRVLEAPEGSPLIAVEADGALPPLPAMLPPTATYVLGHDALGLSPALAARCDARHGPPPGWSAATSPAMLAHLLMWRLRGLSVVRSGPYGAISHRAPVWQEDWAGLTRAEQRARLPFDWWVRAFAWEVRRDWWVCLPQAQTPLNAVALARNALAAGAAGIITAADPGPERAPLGTHWRVDGFEAVVDRARGEGLPLVALEQGGTPLGAGVLPERGVLVAGHEVRGLSARELRACDAVVSLPMWGSVNSYNVASAAGLALDAAPLRPARS
jgi:tRNA G18 (ribose-2'-O)-methylase SpoU